jgi:acyl carrier protein
MQPPIEQTLRDFILENFTYRSDRTLLAEDTSFLETGLIDSTGVLELVGFLEDRFQIQVADDEIVPDNMDSLRRLGQYVRRKLQPCNNGATVSHAV